MQIKKTIASLKQIPRAAWALIIIIILVIAGYWFYTSQMNTSDSSAAGDNSNAPASTTGATTSAAAPKKAASAAPVSSRKLSTVVSITQGLRNASQFISLFKSTGVAAQITGKGPYTIFVPTNGAFSQLPPGTITKMTGAQKLRFIQYHVIVGRAIDPQAQTAGTIQALSGDALNFSYGPDKIPLVGSAIFLKKYQASNGVVYLIDNVLLPPQR